MCRKVTCSTCKRPTWAGCGAHVDLVLRNVPPAERCQCHRGQKTSTRSSEHRQSWLSRLRGR
ncbi:MAG: hypothetical protein M3P52_01400 [Actinomycetota bacterium]|nr:hypothetical protein [Actinomycetota bacterium]